MTTKALRYYERVGLLPEPDRTDSGYRDYGHTVFDRLRFIRAAQAVGLTLGEIRGIIAFANKAARPAHTSSRSSKTAPPTSTDASSS